MDYAAQQRYFGRSLLWGGLAVSLLLAAGAWVLWSSWNWASVPARVAFALIIIPTAASLRYTPDYLHLSVHPDKPARWAIKVRWRIAAALLFLGVALSPNEGSVAVFSASAIWIVLTTLVARRFSQMPLLSLHFVISDLLLIYALFFALGSVKLAVMAACVAAVFHFSTVIWRHTPWILTASFVVCSALLVVPFVLFWLLLVSRGTPGELLALAAYPAVVVASLISTSALLLRAIRQCKRNITSAITELCEFTRYDEARIRELWSTADKQLAQNWESSGVANKSPEEIADWYRQNSELYMFAISAYNLEYKRIKSNLKMLSYASGRCLDYGAGNGELILELARRGHRAAYYDVDGVSKRFAQFRAAKYGLNVEFASTKDELRQIAAVQPFDTIFSFDVLEHIPDLAAELDFLISLLAPNGVLLFDVPAGATVNHPMHLNHTLNVRQHLLARGMKEIPMRSWRLGKQEKYAFRLVLHPERSEGSILSRSTVGQR